MAGRLRVIGANRGARAIALNRAADASDPCGQNMRVGDTRKAVWRALWQGFEVREGLAIALAQSIEKLLAGWVCEGFEDVFHEMFVRE
ncbi:MAG: hypothetical protein ABF254_12605 [Octadecabacter sp.]